MNKEAQLLKESAELLRKVAQERDGALEREQGLLSKIALYERHVEAEKVAAMMHQRGINIDVPFGDLVSTLTKSAEDGKLGTIREAVTMVGTDMGVKTASVSEHTAGNMANPLEQYLLGFVG